MKLAECLLTDQVFSHTDPQGVVRHFNSSAILRAIMRKELAPHTRYQEVQITAELAEFIIKNHGIELDHLDRISEDSTLEPVLLACFDDGTQCMIDGNHRFVKRQRMGKDTIPAIWVEPKGWEPYLVEDMDALVPDVVVPMFLQELGKQVHKRTKG